MALTDQINSAFARVAAEFKAVRSEMAALSTGGSGGTTSDPNIIYVESQTGSTDQARLTAAWAKLGPGKVLKLRDGATYVQTAVLTDGGRGGYTIEGRATIQATNPAAASIRVDGDNVTWRNWRHQVVNRGTRLDTYNSEANLIFGDNFSAFNCISEGGAATGWFLTGSIGFRLILCSALDTFADGFHITGGSSDGTVILPYAKEVGDDGVAIVSYTIGYNPGRCSNIEVIRPTVHGSRAGRGITCVGGNNVRFFDIDVDDTFAAGVYIANETYGSTPIMEVNDILVSGGRIRRANRNTDPNNLANPVDHGSILVSSQRSGVTNRRVTIEGLSIYDTRRTAPWEVGCLAGAGNNDGITFRDLRFINPAFGPGTTQNPINYFAGFSGGANTDVQFYGWEVINKTDGKLTGGTGSGAIVIAPATAGTGAPIVDAGPDTSVALNTAVSRTATETGGAPTSRTWLNVGTGATLSTTATVSFTPTTAGTTTLRYTASNSTGSAIDEFVVTATTTAAGSPIANAGVDRTTVKGTPITLTGTTTGGTPTAYEWKIVSGPAFIGTIISTGATAGFAGSTVGTFVVRFTTTNGSGSTTDDVTVTVTAS